MDLEVYHRMLNQGFSERESVRGAEEAWETDRLRHARRREMPRPSPQLPQCDICGNYQSVAESNGYGVCSQECSNVALARGEPGG